ncbi:Putative acyl-CoA dehydrogenase FadE17 [Alphaproteobacteria bacterium SO-S41]|nr:Putative acyl-CoA dehydrogenase FadE17 [Alphaproteobacteria bacterium SO-S41]
MEFAWTDEHRAYRARVRGFIERELPADWFENYAHGVGTNEQIDFSRSFCKKLADEGLLVPQWPRRFGGADGDPWQQFILSEEMWSWNEPRGPQYMGVNWIGPALMRFGTPAQQDEHLKRISTGTVVWAQGFSEPQAGTDLAALKTKAERTAGGYKINGMKIWTSYARRADWIFLLARTGQERKSISCFLVPMNSPGVKVVPFPGLVEEGHLNEVYFDDVEVPESALIGEEGKGWNVIRYALSYERVGVPRYHRARMVLDATVAQLKREGRFSDSIVRAWAGRIVAKCEAARLLTYVVVHQRITGEDTVDPNVQRLTGAEACLDLMNFLITYVPDCLAGGDPYIANFYRSQISGTIAAGTYELQLDLVAQRGLGMPRSG